MTVPINIVYQPYQGLLESGRYVHTKYRSNKLHFFKVIGDNAFYDDFAKKDLDELLAVDNMNYEYLGWLELKKN